MSFKAVWGFDPDEVARAQAALHQRSDPDESSYNIAEERAARIPADTVHRSMNSGGFSVCRNGDVLYADMTDFGHIPCRS
jgi:hypothetical protein